jgi:hypothetical protein
LPYKALLRPSSSVGCFGGSLGLGFYSLASLLELVVSLSILLCGFGALVNLAGVLTELLLDGLAEST